ncbi:MAG: hypothetical protein SFW62_06015 [Alphaproteobacteria bacterium]|nr:hypothetical protein [Alphaproteobacteria bacterium]
MSQVVFGIVGPSENDALTAATSCYAYALNRLGYDARVIDFRVPELAQSFKQHIQKGDIAFAFGLQGVGSQLKAGDNTTCLWTAIKKPFISLHNDHPCHNIHNHYGDSSFVANLYHFDSFREAKEKYLPSGQISKYMPMGFAVADSSPRIAFAERPIKFLYMKNSCDLSAEQAYCDALPAPLRDAVRQQTERALKNPNLELCDLVDEVFTSHGFSRHQLWDEFWDIARVMDRSIRHARAAAFIEWLKFQEGAVIIGDGWDTVDKTGTRAVFKPAMSAYASHMLYQQSQIVCNTNPYGRDIIHERTMAGLGIGACVFSDTNGWWEKNASDIASLALYNWSDPLDDQLQSHLKDMKKAGEAASASVAAYHRLFPAQDVGQLVRLAEDVRSQNGN